jgi:hypothetical protein
VSSKSVGFLIFIFALGFAIGLSVHHLASSGARENYRERVAALENRLVSIEGRNRALEFELEQSQGRAEEIRERLDSSLNRVAGIEELLAELDGLLAWLSDSPGPGGFSGELD